MRQMIFRVNQLVYDYLKKERNNVLHDDNFKIMIDDGPVGHKDEGLVCVGCGNRGDIRPFEIIGKRQTSVTIKSDGSLNISVDKQQHNKIINNIIEGDHWSYGSVGDERMLGNASKEFLYCTNCQSGMVMPAEIAMAKCDAGECSGCYICNEYEEPEDVLYRCAYCSILMRMMDEEPSDTESDDCVLSKWCADVECGNLFARESVYDFTLEDILIKMRKEGMA